MGNLKVKMCIYYGTERVIIFGLTILLLIGRLTHDTPMLRAYLEDVNLK